MHQLLGISHLVALLYSVENFVLEGECGRMQDHLHNELERLKMQVASMDGYEQWCAARGEDEAHDVCLSD